MFTHSKNSHFQYTYFLAGKCHTADEAYRVLKDQLDDRELAIEMNQDKVPAGDKRGQELLAEAKRERDFIQNMIATIDPFRKYRHLPDHEAMQACQREEWGLELIRRAENFLLMSGAIPADQIEAMRLHPDFDEVIFPRIMAIEQARLRGHLLTVPKPTWVQTIEKLLPHNEPLQMPTGQVRAMLPGSRPQQLKE